MALDNDSGGPPVILAQDITEKIRLLKQVKSADIFDSASAMLQLAFTQGEIIVGLKLVNSLKTEVQDFSQRMVKEFCKKCGLCCKDQKCIAAEPKKKNKELVYRCMIYHQKGIEVELAYLKQKNLESLSPEKLQKLRNKKLPGISRPEICEQYTPFNAVFYDLFRDTARRTAHYGCIKAFEAAARERGVTLPRGKLPSAVRLPQGH